MLEAAFSKLTENERIQGHFQEEEHPMIKYKGIINSF